MNNVAGTTGPIRSAINARRRALSPFLGRRLKDQHQAISHYGGPKGHWKKMGTGHETVLLDAAVDALICDPAGTYVDGTFGRGGHSRAILKRLGSPGRLVALDRDPAAIAAAKAITDPNFTIVKAAFADLGEVLAGLGIERVAGVLLDLGVSSPQLDDAGRGFSFQHDGPLDMRMDPTTGSSAADWIADVEESELARVLYEYGEERFSRRIARAIVRERATRRITTTAELADVIAQATPTRDRHKHPATRSFQAIRIAVNGELDQLDDVLEQSLDMLGDGGRLVVISFHSLEDRRVKQFIAQRSRAARPPSRRLPPDPNAPAPVLRNLGRTRPDDREVAANPRARSAVMRVAERLPR